MSSKDPADYTQEEVIAANIANTMRELAEAKAEQEKEADSVRPERSRLLMALALTRYKQGLSQAELADRVGMPQSALSRLENGRGNPSLDTLLKVAKALGVNLVVE